MTATGKVTNIVVISTNFQVPMLGRGEKKGERGGERKENEGEEGRREEGRGG